MQSSTYKGQQKQETTGKGLSDGLEGDGKESTPQMAGLRWEERQASPSLVLEPMSYRAFPPLGNLGSIDH